MGGITTRAIMAVYRKGSGQGELIPMLMLKRKSTVVFGIHCYPMWGQREVSKISHLGFLDSAQLV